MDSNTKMVSVDVAGLTLDPTSSAPIVVLKEKDGKRIVPIWIGIMEAHAILQVIENISLPRPMTHDLLKTFLQTVGIGVKSIEINELRDNTYYATIIAEADKKEHRIDSRPSDAIALALRMKAPIHVAENVIEDSKAIVVENDEKLLELASSKEKIDKLSKILETLSDDAFGKYKQ